MSEWISCTLGDVAECIQTGPFGSQLHQSDYSVTGIPVVMPQDMVNGRIDTADIARVEQHHVDRLKRHKLQEGDIVYSRRGDVGRCAYVEKHQEGWLCGTGCLLVRLDKAKVHPRFIAYYLRLPSQVTWVENNAVGITMLNLNTGILSKAPLRIPRSIDEQKRIADTLESMDAKIKHNIELTQTLEEQAQLVYDYWFMQFDFPDENGRPYRSSGGKMKWCEELKREIPEGWGAGTLKDVADVVGGSTPSTSNPNNFSTGEDSIPWITPKDLSGNADFYIGRGRVSLSESGRKEASLSYLPEGSILFSSRAPIGYIAIAANDVTTNQGFKSLVPHDKAYTPYLFFLMRSLVPYFVQSAGVTTFKEISGSQVKGTPLIIPETRILHRFAEIVAPLFELRRLVEEETRELAAQRDFLLPRLMTGEITVAE